MIETIDNQKTQKEPQAETLDLSELTSISFGPEWSTDRKQSLKLKQEREPRDKAERHFTRKRPERSERSHKKGRRTMKPDYYRPTVDVVLYPEPKPFDVLMNALKISGKTYPLFDIARLILAKNDRFRVLVRPIQKASEVPPCLYLSIADQIPFEHEKDAIDHALKQCFEKFFDLEVETVEPPKGSFQIINRCKSTGVLLGPPNYHRYQELLRAHQYKHFSQLSVEQVEQKIEPVKGEEVVNQWLEQMTQQQRYRWKSKDDEKSIVFDNIDRAQQYLLKEQKKQLVRSCNSIRFAGVDLEKLPPSNSIAQAVKYKLETQKRFPLEVANNLRKKLRKANFSIYKKGSKGISFVCGIKRKFRKPGQVFADSIQSLINHIEKHPYMEVSGLSKNVLGIDLDTEEGKSLPLDKQKELNELRNSLHWLITEGYVIEYSDGKLFAPPAQKPTETILQKGTEKEDSGKTDEIAASAIVDESSQKEEDVKGSAELP